ncbi:MAG: globin domain-containing protein [Anaerolineae bacterium]
MTEITPGQKGLARQAFERVAPMADSLALLFYARLFEVAPYLRPLFHVDLEELGHSLMAMLQLCMEALDAREDLVYALSNLGARHVEYGARPQDYGPVKATLVWTMQQGLGSEWNAEYEDALEAVFGMIVDLMQPK